MRAAIYTRISQDRKPPTHDRPTGPQREAEAGIRRQEQKCRALIKARGWTYIGTYTDNDISAFSGKRRPGYEQLLASMRSGETQVVVAWHTDRLYRRLKDLATFVEVCVAHKVSVATVQAGDIDLSTAAGRMIAGILGSVAQNESEQKAERIQEQRAQAALAGEWNGGPRTFGFTKEMVIVPSEADLVREMADRLLAGDSIRSVVRDLNERAVPTLRGGRWRTTTVRSMMVAARMSGQREHTPRSQGRGYGFGEIVAQGSWEPILTPVQTERLRQLLGDPLRRTYRPSQRLLSGGVLRCGRCGEPLNSRTVAGSSHWRYACIRHPGSQRCGGLSVVGLPLDQLVTDMVLQALAFPGRDSRPPKTASPSPGHADPGLSQQVADCLRRMDELAGDMAAGMISRREWLAARRRVDAQVESLRAAMVIKDDQAAVAGLPSDAASLLVVWDEMHIDRQRAVVAAVVDSITVLPAATRGRPTFDPTRVEVSWRA